MDLRLKFNEDEKNYDSYRPTYPKELFSDIINYSNISSGCKALEIGIGTGQATVPILQVGCKVTAIELGANLTQYVKAKYRDYTNFEVINADFIEHPIKSQTLNLVYCATAFHWLPLEEGYTKVRNILKDDGTIALFWNHPFPNRKDDISNIANKKIYDKYRPSNKEIIEFSKNDCQQHIDELARFGFKDIISKLYHRQRTFASDEYISLLNTYSDHRALPMEIKNDFERDMKNAIDEIGGKINIYDTIDLYLARKG
ncbi:class I SAM-dependent methyltransferase [Clostridium gasigenes]|uniref:class I SAM-dependent methyltransferase n=1 Tax=Clostridium gasigenes TaxID=94869 RepID=UPI0014383EBC|nr:class I SAM-dependent methyltransferase [Clostridium gasigenes]NKF07583.1 class I SAM-dependent methyltransferase [Clostridium gasigenes]QSW18013.1 class I SAM-dependent methyltransferase [Clostridium gasigenes]